MTTTEARRTAGKSRRDRKHRPKSRWPRLVASVLLTIVVAMVGFFTLALAMPISTPAVPTATTVLDVRNRVAARLFTQHRIEIPLEEMPVHIRQAIISVEDERFLNHAGVDPVALGRALFRNLKAGRIVEGGSTITQQLAKNLFFTPERTVTRKIQEALVTVKLERVYEKNQILEMYLNQIYWGHGAYGIEVASQAYFAKSASDLTLGEAALLAGIVRSPERLSPYRDMAAALERRHLVLDKMTHQGFIDRETAEAASREPVRLAGLRQSQNLAPYFVEYVVHLMAEMHPEISESDIWRGGYTIKTTMDLDMQVAAETAMQMRLPEGTRDQNGILQPQAALVAIDPTNGHIRAMVGGRDYGESTWNRAWRAQRQPGSAFKPFVYVAAIDMGFTPADRQRCEPVTFRGPVPGETWSPRDYGSKPYHYRSMAMREAIRISDNVVAVKWADVVGPMAVAHYARKMGVESQLETDLSLALGTSSVTPLEMAASYCPLANGGDRVRPIAILAVEDRNGILLEAQTPVREQAIDERVAFTVTDLLKSVLGPGGTGEHLGPLLDRPVAAKTGTSSDVRDAWFVGYTPDLVAAVYVGYDDQSRSLAGGGGAVAGPIWASFMRDALAGKPPRDFQRPKGMVTAEICPDTGKLASTFCPEPYKEVFIEGKAPRDTCQGPHSPRGDASNPEADEPEEQDDLRGEVLEPATDDPVEDTPPGRMETGSEPWKDPGEAQ